MSKHLKDFQAGFADYQILSTPQFSDHVLAAHVIAAFDFEFSCEST